jgi:hypothetical protein
MEPLQTITMPTQGVLVGIDSANSWQAGSPDKPVRLAYIATDSTERMSFCSLQAGASVLKVGSRPSNFGDMEYGVVVEVYLSADLGEGETVWLALAQAGATTYFPPQQIDDLG